MITPVIMERTGLRYSSRRPAPGVVAGLFCGCILVVAFFESVTKSMCLLAMVALTRYYIAGKPFTDPKPVVLQDVMATLHLKNVLETVYTLETVVKEEHLQLRCRETPGLLILKSTVTTKRQNPNSLFSIVELPEDIVSSISSAIRILKIPNSEVVKFVKDFADKFECRNSERAMKIEYYRLREEIAIS
ncbi:uncharacterized protein LOC119737972 [Patiria miniata]|uniref:Uncharacterized protein n=1 Tax=Patiria miniata TaxID=46514 RepID=A0A914B8S2_PATMI|nr:uncharacterized protein LOC119737972 [Patiria miniata]